MGIGMVARRRDERSLKERLALEAIQLREKARRLPIGAEREELLKKARRLDVASELDEWLSSPGLKPPS
jgi:hypothetical protein